METRMNHTTPPPEPLIREIPLICLALAPENVRKTPANQSAEAELVASIKAHGLLENLVARPAEPAADGASRPSLRSPRTAGSTPSIPCRARSSETVTLASSRSRRTSFASRCTPPTRWSRSASSPSRASPLLRGSPARGTHTNVCNRESANRRDPPAFAAAARWRRRS